jgi:two-component system, LytTR family, response regulator
MMIRVLIVDDMPLARRRIKRNLSADQEVEVVGECADGRAAVEAIRELRPDLIFLDVQLPKMDGFEVIEEVGAELIPAVIFVTAYDQFALRAFEVHAFDYLLKPFDRERFRKTVERAKEELRRRQPDELGERLRALLLDVRAQPKYLKRVKVKSSGHTLILPAEEIDFIETAGNYLRLQVGKSSYLIRESLSAFEAQLDPEVFARIHRSTIVNLERIKEMYPLFNGDQTIVLRDGTKLTMSRNYRDRLLSLL